MKKSWVTIFIGLTILCGFISPSASFGAEPIIIGVPTSLANLEGSESRNAVEIAIDEINAKGGVKLGGVMRPFKMVQADTRDSEPGIPISDALMAYEKLILQQKPHAIIGGFYASEPLLASMDITSKYKLPYLATIPMSQKMQEKIIKNYDQYKYIFRLSYDAPYFVNTLLDVLKKINADFQYNKIFIFSEEALWGRAIGGATAKWAESQGWKVTGNQTFSKGTSDFSSTLLQIKNTNTQVIEFICSRPETIIFADQWLTMKVPAILMGMLPPLCSEDVWKVHKGKVNGVIALTMPAVLPIASIPRSITFFETYKKKFGKPPGSSHGTGEAYDAVYVLKEAIERAGTLDGDKLVAEIEKTDRKGCSGRLRFDKGHQAIFGSDPNETYVALGFQWQKPGKRVIITPVSVATGKIQLPEGMKKQ